jgi:hypothetical protein
VPGRDEDLRQAIEELRVQLEASKRDRADLHEQLEASKRDRADLRQRGRSLKKGFVTLTVWLTFGTAIMGLELKSAIDRIQYNRAEIIRNNCIGHDRFVGGYTAAIDKILADPMELKRRAQRDGVLEADERDRLLASRRATVALVDALQPRNPRDPHDNRSCAAIAKSLS